MAIKSITTPGKVETQPRFPRLMKSKASDTIVLMSSECGYNFTGTVMASYKGGPAVGYSTTLWDKDTFEDYKGSITLENLP